MIRACSHTAPKGFILLESHRILSLHDPERRVPALVAEKLDQATISPKKATRLGLRTDPRLDSEEQAESSDYAHSGWTRGHLARSIHHGRCPRTVRIAFLMSNICPQNAKMNRGAWNRLENELCQRVHELGSAILMSGTIFEDGEALDSIGDNGVQVPTHLYKILLSAEEAPEAWLMPNEGLNYKHDPTEFTACVGRISELSGLPLSWLTKDIFPAAKKD